MKMIFVIARKLYNIKITINLDVRLTPGNAEVQEFD